MSLSYARSKFIKNIAMYAILGVIAVIFLVPFLWALVTSLKQAGQVFTATPQWIPTPPTLEVYKNVLNPRGAVTAQGYYIDPFGLYLFNSFVVALGATAGNLVIGSLAAYAFARLKFPGRDILFALAMGSLLIPIVGVIIPRFIIVRSLGWIDTYQGLIGPYIAGCASTFLLRQYFLSIPMEMEESAKIDGASTWQRYWYVILPNAVPALLTVFIFVFVFTWNLFIWPLIVVTSKEMRVVTIGLVYMRGTIFTDYRILMCGAVLSALPAIVFFVFLQRYYLRGITITGLKL
ncbi:L-arabinose transport system permease protein AraQ [subsurface metagenome]